MAIELPSGVIDWEATRSDISLSSALNLFVKKLPSKCTYFTGILPSRANVELRAFKMSC
ncbi:hypothetical protein M758_UG079700 [Ceratodon purpureus]|nr:hypothetical protein M758_UG079700 [Ceratodon purpureus]